MIKIKGYKYRIYPNEEQKRIIDNTTFCCRYVWNGFLALKMFKYKEFGEKLSFKDMSALLTEIKKSDTFLKESDSTALQQTLRQLDETYKRFFKGLCKYPKFKSKKNPKDSYKSTTVKIKEDKLLIPKVGLVEVAWSRKFTGRIISATISKTPTNKYFISITVEESSEHLPKIYKEIGIDVGLKTFAVCSDGREYKAPKPLWKYIKRLKFLQRKLSKRNKQSKNYLKMKLKIAELHERIVNIRKDFQHKLSTKLIRENQSIYLEDINFNNWMKNKKWAKVVADNSFYSFINMLEYKARKYGRTIQKVDKFFPSSQLCSCCGNRQKMSIDKRIYKCECGLEIDRDLNASINILAEGRRLTRG